MNQPSRIIRAIFVCELLVLGVLWLPSIHRPPKPSPYQYSDFNWPAGTVTARCKIYPDDPGQWRTNCFKMRGTLDQILKKIHELQGYELDDIVGNNIMLRRASIPDREHLAWVEVFPDPPPKTEAAVPGGEEKAKN